MIGGSSMPMSLKKHLKGLLEQMEKIINPIK